MDNMQIYSVGRTVPAEAKRAISAGRLKGMTDINPMWRIKLLTELFGPCGFGWVYAEPKYETETFANGTAICHCTIALKVKFEGEWSEPIYGTGGTVIAGIERSGELHADDDARKKSLTDALSVACKALGIGADVYFASDTDKYITTPQQDPPQQQKQQQQEQKQQEQKQQEQIPEKPRQQKPVKAIPYATPEQIGQIRMLCDADQIKALCQQRGVMDLEHMPSVSAEYYIRAMKQRIAKQGENESAV